MTIVNIKKASGINRVSNDELWEYAYQDAKLIREQVVTILKPNIIVCGGGSSTILNIAKQIIYQDTFFVKINDWCYYSKEKDLLLIDSWHPKAIISLEDKYDKMMIAVRDFISKTESNTFQQ